ncbi:MAG: hypothetical protein M3R55_15025, partial [Acidobacteriota bacterium]|nr:hypothetical protein [Acidobacteriota bacterium]
MALLAISASLLSAAPMQRTPRVTELLDLYLKGDHAAATEPLRKVQNARNYAIDLAVDGGDWIKRGDDPARRRLAAASLALEFAVLRMDDEWQTLRPLIEWGCQLLRTGPSGPAGPPSAPSAPELAWQRAALAAIQGARDNLFAQRAPTGAAIRIDLPFMADHVQHVALRFPDDPVVRFAEGFFAEFQVPVEGRSRTIDGDTASRAAARAMDAYRAASADPELAAESALAIGYIQLRLKRLDSVLP